MRVATRKTTGGLVDAQHPLVNVRHGGSVVEATGNAVVLTFGDAAGSELVTIEMTHEEWKRLAGRVSFLGKPQDRKWP